MLEKFKGNVMKLTLGGIALFIFGIFIGIQLNSGAIDSIQGFLFNVTRNSSATNSNATKSNATNSNATNSNATNSNATNSNATNSNATNSNATNSNATNSNAEDPSATDNIIYLESFHLITKEANAGDTVYVSFETSGACLNGITVTLKNQKNNTTFTALVKSIDDDPYIILPSNLSTSSYIVTDVLLIGLNSDKTTFSKHYNNNSIELKDTVSVKEKVVVTPVKLNSISIDPTDVSVGSKINVTFDVNKSLQSLKLEFKSTDNKTMVVYVKSLTNKPYFEIPTTTVGGTYSLYSATLTSSDSTKVYTTNGSNGSLKFNFNSKLVISDGTETSFIYNNEDINSQIITKLYNSKEKTEITINADSNTIIDKELFNTIKGKDKTLIINHSDNQLVFNGNDIKNSKTIDVNMLIEETTANENIRKLVSKGIIVNFPDNGNLPGNALVRVKATEDINKLLGDKIYVYFYNESSNNFSVIAEDVKKKDDGYYEFTISHNSDYLLVNKKIDSKLVVSQNIDNVVSFQKSNGTYLLLIGVGVVVAISLAIVIIVVRKKKEIK